MARGVQHFGGTAEGNRLFLLPHCDCGKKDGDDAVLAPRQAILRMADNLKKELPIAPFVQ
jgi:hypothetical protein